VFWLQPANRRVAARSSGAHLRRGLFM
jgi:hypothetical protein